MVFTILQRDPPPSLALLAPTATQTSSSAPQPTLDIGNGSGTIYSYAGCWNETTDLPDTTGLRALDGVNESLPGFMTVARCLDFCANGNDKTYQLAGLEFSRECWCADKLNSLSVQLPDALCNMPCDGQKSTACGGALRLSLYNATGADTAESAAAEWRGGRALSGLVVGLVVLVCFEAFLR
ncbi:WSC domain-containing protein [Xylaria nigripes]|nr:WSC domain-containing protein [Xylaria nigripes]